MNSKKKLLDVVLDNPIIWQIFRSIVESAFNGYSKRFRLLQEIHVNENSSILEFGCGNALFAKFFQGQYIGIDSSEPHLAEARIKFPHHEFYSSIKDVDTTKKDVDCALMMDVAHHLDDETLQTVLLAIANLSPNKLVIFDPIRNNQNIFGEILCRLDRGKYIRSDKKIARTLTNCGFKIERLIPYKIGPTNCIMICASHSHNAI